MATTLIESFEKPCFGMQPEPAELSNLSGVEDEKTANVKNLEDGGFEGGRNQGIIQQGM